MAVEPAAVASAVAVSTSIHGNYNTQLGLTCSHIEVPLRPV